MFGPHLLMVFVVHHSSFPLATTTRWPIPLRSAENSAPAAVAPPPEGALVLRSPPASRLPSTTSCPSASPCQCQSPGQFAPGPFRASVHNAPAALPTQAAVAMCRCPASHCSAAFFLTAGLYPLEG